MRLRNIAVLLASTQISRVFCFPQLFPGLGSGFGSAPGSGVPQIFQDDPRFMQYKPAGPGDSRSPCPALNSIANHGFIPHSGKSVNLIQIIVGLFQGLGVSPEVSAFVAAVGYASSSNILALSFDLEDLSKHMFLIEHDCSFSRQDALIGDNNNFNQTLWNVALNELPAVVTAIDAGRAKSARIQDAYRQNPRSVYGPRAAAFGFLEHGLFLSALGTPLLGTAKREYVRSFFEEERLPYHLGWRVFYESNNVATVAYLGAASILGDSQILRDAGRIVISSPSDILETLIPPEANFLTNITALVEGAGFDSGRYINQLQAALPASRQLK